MSSCLRYADRGNGLENLGLSSCMIPPDYLLESLVYGDGFCGNSLVTCGSSSRLLVQNWRVTVGFVILLNESNR